MGDAGGVAKLVEFLPTNDPSSAGPVAHSCPWMCSETSVVATAGDCGVNCANFAAGIAFWKLICKQSPTFARNAIGRGRFPGRSQMLPLLVTVSERSAKTNPLGIVAPSRFIMIGCGIATTGLVILGVPGGQGTICGGAAATASAGSVSVLIGTAGDVSSFLAVDVSIIGTAV